ncbi:MAG TPA: acyltransferase [Porphyromonadaceae bacterium]|nr:MAG: acyltransferase [Bacteroidetes bacterium GWC2_46_850]HBB02000.1 acyltransferase [Porphyromonadaceae bacterium]HCC19485.1 acyltransferase [Porphyromonadaceae bacterium]
MTTTMTAPMSDSKTHYHLLDGLRGVAALMVIIYHCYECFPPESWIIGHGYLAVDFFFILSGFVIGYAYDDRWNKSSTKKLTYGQFFRRRLIRLHPMVVFGILWGVVTFFIQGGVKWDGTHVTISAVMIAVLLHLFMIPEVPGAMSEVRGNGEMFPLNGPHWSLFFEYIGNILYALFLRKLSTRWLGIVTAIIGICWALFFLSDMVGYGNMGVGWTLEGANFGGGLLRMLFPFSVGLYMSRVFKPVKVRGVFWICTAILVLLLSLPSMGSDNTAWVNIVFELVCVAIAFPFVVLLAASGQTTDPLTTSLCKFMGDISYPLYAVHYPTMYLFYAYIGFPETWRTPAQTWQWMVLLVVGNIVLAYLALKLYDQPVRKWLTSRKRIYKIETYIQISE